MELAEAARVPQEHHEDTRNSLHRRRGARCRLHGEGTVVSSKDLERLLFVRQGPADGMAPPKVGEGKEAAASGRTTPFLVMLSLTTAFFVVELVGGIVTGSLALQSDAFHMASDVLALIVGVVAANMSTKGRDSHPEGATYGYQRAEVAAGLVNGTFLLAVCFTIFLEAIERFAHMSEVQETMEGQADTILVIGAIGLAINLLGLVVFHDHGHGHGHGGHDHSHSHGHAHGHGHGHGHGNGGRSSSRMGDLLAHGSDRCGREGGHDHDHDHGHGHDHSHGHAHGHACERASGEHASSSHDPLHAHGHTHSAGGGGGGGGGGGRLDVGLHASRLELGEVGGLAGHETSPAGVSAAAAAAATAREHGHGYGHGYSENAHGVMLHILGDALGSVAVMVSALAIKYGEESMGDARFVFDPAASVFIVAIIAWHTVPFVKSCLDILLQHAPSWLDMSALRSQIEAMPDIVDIHELHVWQMDTSRAMCTMHVAVCDQAAMSRAPHAVRSVLHKYGLHCSTIQAEMVPLAAASAKPMGAGGADAHGSPTTPVYMCTDMLCDDHLCADKQCC